ncbi:hypothetical protein ACFL48_04255 [Pseudomonadota bacterium]
MKFYGYKQEVHLQVKDTEPSELSEVTLMASPEELRKISIFVNSMADELEKRGSEFDHGHLSDSHPELDGTPQFVIAKPQLIK